MFRFFLITALLFSFNCLAGEPQNLEECRSMLKPLLTGKCETLFADASQAAQKKACLDNIEQGLKTCDNFFGQNSDFCSACTNSCINNYQETSPQRQECLQTCMTHKGCQK